MPEEDTQDCIFVCRSYQPSVKGTRAGPLLAYALVDIETAQSRVAREPVSLKAAPGL